MKSLLFILAIASSGSFCEHILPSPNGGTLNSAILDKETGICYIPHYVGSEECLPNELFKYNITGDKWYVSNRGPLSKSGETFQNIDKIPDDVISMRDNICKEYSMRMNSVQEKKNCHPVHYIRKHHGHTYPIMKKVHSVPNLMPRRRRHCRWVCDEEVIPTQNPIIQEQVDTQAETRSFIPKQESSTNQETCQIFNREKQEISPSPRQTRGESCQTCNQEKQVQEQQIMSKSSSLPKQEKYKHCNRKKIETCQICNKEKKDTYQSCNQETKAISQPRKISEPDVIQMNQQEGAQVHRSEVIKATPMCYPMTSSKMIERPNITMIPREEVKMISEESSNVRIPEISTQQKIISEANCQILPILHSGLLMKPQDEPIFSYQETNSEMKIPESMQSAQIQTQPTEMVKLLPTQHYSPPESSLNSSPQPIQGTIPSAMEPQCKIVAIEQQSTQPLATLNEAVQEKFFRRPTESSNEEMLTQTLDKIGQKLEENGRLPQRIEPLTSVQTGQNDTGCSSCTATKNMKDPLSTSLANEITDAFKARNANIQLLQDNDKSSRQLPSKINDECDTNDEVDDTIDNSEDEDNDEDEDEDEDELD